jgi:hypothetical protein
MKVVYLSGPYRSNTVHGIVENIRKAEKYAIQLWDEGYAVICPHKNSALLDGIVPDDCFLEGDKEILRRCDIIYMMPGWEYSEGAKAEHQLAKDLGISIIYIR